MVVTDNETLTAEKDSNRFFINERHFQINFNEAGIYKETGLNESITYTIDGASINLFMKNDTAINEILHLRGKKLVVKKEKEKSRRW